MQLERGAKLAGSGPTAQGTGDLFMKRRLLLASDR